LALSEQKPAFADGNASGGSDLLAGVQVFDSNPLGIEVAADTWLRQDDSGRALMVVLSGFMALFLGSIATGVLLGPVQDEPVIAVIALEIGLACFGALFGWIAIRRARAGLRMSAEGVCLRGLIKTHRLALDDVEGFEPGIFTAIPGHDEIGVKLLRRGQRVLEIWTMAAGGAVTTAGKEEGKTALQPLCDELNRLLGDLQRRKDGQH
jgi:hypothetical protein